MKGHHLPTDLPTDLDAILRSIWEAFEVGVREAGHPFHTPIVATAGPADCDARVVVLRRASPDRRELAFHTDARAPKVRLLQACHTTAWVFYDPAGKVQVRAKGNTVVHQGDAVAADAWAHTRLMSRRCYLAEAAPAPRPIPPPADYRRHWWSGRRRRKKVKPALSTLPSASRRLSGWTGFSLRPAATGGPPSPGTIMPPAGVATG
jgi:pyridoxine/pyridoxamine 5'-phosphate oxidase